MGVLPRTAEDTCKEALRDAVAEREKALTAQDFDQACECDKAIDTLLAQLFEMSR